MMKRMFGFCFAMCTYLLIGGNQRKTAAGHVEPISTRPQNRIVAVSLMERTGMRHSSESALLLERQSFFSWVLLHPQPQNFAAFLQFGTTARMCDSDTP